MASKITTRAQLFLRIALSLSYLSAVADRCGLWGAPGSAGVNWGNWENFVAYSNSINSFVPERLGNLLAIAATAAEIILSVMLLIGYRLKLMALASAVLLSIFAIAMTVSFGIQPALTYSVWTGAAASYLLSTLLKES